MTTSLTVQSVVGAVNATYSDDTPLVPLSINPRISAALTLANGTSGAGKANKMYASERTLAPSATETLNLVALVDPLGHAVDFTSLLAILIILQPTTAADHLLVGAATNPCSTFLGSDTDKITIRNGPNGGVLLLGCGDATGYVVTPTTGINLKIANGDGALAAHYDIVLIGRG